MLPGNVPRSCPHCQTRDALTVSIGESGPIVRPITLLSGCLPEHVVYQAVCACCNKTLFPPDMCGGARGPFSVENTHLLVYVLESAGWSVATPKHVHAVFAHELFHFYRDLKAIQHESSDRAIVDLIIKRTRNIHLVGQPGGTPIVDRKLFGLSFQHFEEAEHKATSAHEDFVPKGHVGQCPSHSQKRNYGIERGIAGAKAGDGRVCAPFAVHRVRTIELTLRNAQELGMAIYDANLAIKQMANAGRTREAAHRAAGHVLPFVEPRRGSCKLFLQ